MVEKCRCGSVEETKALMLQMRQDGMTQKEIAQKTGYSLPRVQQLVGADSPAHVRVWTKARCRWPELRYWLNANNMSVKKLVTMMGFVYAPDTGKRIAQCLAGARELKKAEIDTLMKLTGKPYELLFREEC